MTTLPPITDDALMKLVQSADPLDGDPAADATAEALLRQILASPRVERRRRRPSPSASVPSGPRRSPRSERSC